MRTKSVMPAKRRDALEDDDEFRNDCSFNSGGVSHRLADLAGDALKEEQKEGGDL